MADRNRQILLDLVQKPGNNTCADCGSKDPSWASCNIGVFLCQDCAGIHRGLTTDLSRVKSIKLDNWEDNQVRKMADIGNEIAKGKYEVFLPPFYKRPKKSDPEILKSEWIQAKYGRKEFMEPSKQEEYTSQQKEGVLMKRGRDDKKFQPRKFFLCRNTNKLTYFIKEGARSAKAELDLDDVNVVFVPEKIGNPNGMQITYIEKGSTRNLFVYSDNPKDVVDWYHAIRAAKLERRRIAFPDRDEAELAEDLTRDFVCEGYLSKSGPKNEPYRKRFFTLDRRKLMYLEDPLYPYAKGEVFIGHRDGGYSVNIGVPDGKTSPGGHCLTLCTPDRDFHLSADTKEDMERWILAFQRVLEMPITTQDTKLASMLVPKRSESFKQKFRPR